MKREAEEEEKGRGGESRSGSQWVCPDDVPKNT